MAGDWIKMRADLLSSPQFKRLCNEIHATPTELLFLLYRLAEWFEKHAAYGQMKSCDASAIDGFLGRSGIADGLKACGWLKEAGGSVRLSSFCAPSASRKSLGEKVRTEVLASGMCAACGSKQDLVIDHAVPIVRGGTSARHNLQCLCAPCNRAKGRKTMEEFLKAHARGRGTT